MDLEKHNQLLKYIQDNQIPCVVILLDDNGVAATMTPYDADLTSEILKDAMELELMEKDEKVVMYLHKDRKDIN